MTSPPREKTRPRAATHRAPAPSRRRPPGRRWPGHRWEFRLLQFRRTQWPRWQWHPRQWPRWQWVAAIGAAGLTALVVVIVFAFGGGAGPTAAGSSGAPSALPITVHHRALKVTPEQAVASLHVPPKLARALIRWDAGPGGAALAQVSGDLGNAIQYSGVRLLGPMLQACSSLATAVRTADASPPIPNVGIQGSYRRSLAELATVAADCRAGLSQYPTQDQGLQTRANPAILDKAKSELAAGSKALYQATVDISAVKKHAAS